MDNERSKKSSKLTCSLCDAKFASDVEKNAHCSTALHKFMKSIKNKQMSYLGDAKTLNDQITNAGKNEPLVGLEYVYEYVEDRYGVRMYECTLCESAFKSNVIFFHLVGIQHRVLYLARHHPIMGIAANFELLHLAHYRKLTNNALAIEQTHGRKKINVVDEVYVSKPGVTEPSDSDSGPEDEAPDSNKQSKVGSKGKKDQRAPARPKQEGESRRREDPSRSKERGLESRPGVPRLQLPGEDFDARSMARASIPGSQIVGRALPKIDSAPPYQPGRPFQPGAAALPLVGTIFGRGSTSQDDIDFRRISSKGSSADDVSRKRGRSPDSRSSRSLKRRSRFDKNCDDVDVRSVVPSGGISFRDLRNAHFRNQRGGFSSSHLPLYDKKHEKETDSDMEVCSMEFSDPECDPHDFWCNEELFDFLKTYYIRDEDGVYFILQAIKIMSDALVRYKSRKTQLQQWILEEKQKLEIEKKVFSAIKKRKEEIIFAKMNSTEPGNSKTLQQVAGTKDAPGPGTAKALPKLGRAGLLKMPVPGTVAQQAAQYLQAAGSVTQPLSGFHKALVSGIAPLLPDPFPRPQGGSVTQPLSGFHKPPLLQTPFPRPQGAGSFAQPLSGFHKALVPGISPLLQQPVLRSQGAGSVTQPLSGFHKAPMSAPKPPANVTLSQKAFISGVGPLLQQLFPKLQEQSRVSRFDVGPVQGTGAAMGSGFSQNPQVSGSRFDNLNPSKEPRPLMGTAAGGYSGSETRFNQNPGSRFDNPGPSKEPRPLMELAVGRYSGSETRFGQTAQISSSRFDNPNPSKQPRPLMAQAAGGYSGSDGRFNQNTQFSGSGGDNTGSVNKTNAPAGADYKQTQWNSGAQSGNQDVYKEEEPAPGMGAGRYGGSESTDPIEFTSDDYLGAWSNQDHPNPAKPGVYPAGILKNRTANLP